MQKSNQSKTKLGVLTSCLSVQEAYPPSPLQVIEQSRQITSYDNVHLVNDNCSSEISYKECSIPLPSDLTLHSKMGMVPNMKVTALAFGTSVVRVSGLKV
jgi:hypothetical protein